MKYEVEQKFPVDDLAALRHALVEMGGQLSEPIVQIDRYFAHPSRDFSQTDEAFRIRQVGERNCITYKGPKIDAQTKTRREIELAVESGQTQAESWQEMFQALGFASVALVRKRRQPCRLTWQDAEVEIALDEVDHVGQFVELELVAGTDGLDAARGRILSLAERLGLTGVERRSYLELLLSANVEP